MEPVVRRIADAENFMEGEEHCRLYFKTGKIQFGTSTLMPGKNGAIDPGHKEGEETFFVAKGRAIIYMPSKKKYFELNEGDAILIPPSEPHQLFNPNSEEALLCWSLAPPDKP